MSDRPLTLGTAGHIDHGKTALVRALTGVDTDRLPEEQERGISIALGYASLSLPDGRSLSVVDVPGHDRFVRTMISGATGIDLALIVVACDDGVMPQTREHRRVALAQAARKQVGVALEPDAERRQLGQRQGPATDAGDPAVLARVSDGALVLDCRTLSDADAARIHASA